MPALESPIGVPSEAAGGLLPRPTIGRERILAIDVLRGVAVLGILFMNIPIVGLPYWAGWNPSVAGGDTGLDWWTWFLQSVLVDGKMRAIFSMLFGAGAILLTQRAESGGPEGRAQAADIYYRRMLWLMLFGLIDAYVLLWPGDIIYLYGLCGLVLFPLRRLSARTLIGVGFALILGSLVFDSFAHAHHAAERDKVIEIRALEAAGTALTEEQKDTLEDWKDSIEENRPTPHDLGKELKSRRGGYLSNLAGAAEASKEIHSSPLYLETDVLSMMLIGMGFAKVRVITGGRSSRFYAVLAAVCLPIGWAIATISPLDWSRAGFDPEHIPSWWTTWAWTYQVQRLLISVGYVAVVMLVVRARPLEPLNRAIAAAGRMPLTNYLGQSVFYVILFSGAGFGLIDRLSRFELMLAALGIFTVEVVFSLAWLSRFSFGPLEYLWRRLAYGRRPT